MNNKNLIGFLGVFVIAIIVAQFFLFNGYMLSMNSMHSEMHDNDSHLHEEAMDMNAQRESFIGAKESITGELIAIGDYACCLEKPCAYCIEKSPDHGQGATCDCLSDIMNGSHPCGECIGEIMEGHGNKFLAPYFSKAIAEEMGAQHKSEIMQMITEKYGIAAEDQI